MVFRKKTFRNDTAVIKCWHTGPQTEAIVRDWFAGGISSFSLSGDRSVYIAVPGDGSSLTKIKGAGLKGGPIQFGSYLPRRLVAPVFDFEGRFTEDVASGHHGAFVGGASMQQAVTEWRVSALLQELGYPVVPCLGYGSVFNGQHRSWFSVFSWDSNWIDTLEPPKGTLEDFRSLGKQVGQICLELALEHRLAGYFWVVRDGKGGTLLKDLHPFRTLDPVNMSQLSWVLQVYFAIHVTAFNTRARVTMYHGEDAARDVPLWFLRAFCPHATIEDWDSLRFELVAKYMVQSHPDFSSETLYDLIESNPISARLLELCPPEFASMR